MHVAIFDPYLDTLGGHERYCFDLASALATEHDVAFLWDDSSIVSLASKRFSLPLRGVTTLPNIYTNARSFSSLRQSANFDMLFYVSDGSFPFFAAKRTFLMFEFPVPWVKPNVLTRLKMRTVTQVICNSEFVKHAIDTTFNVSSTVLYPGIDVHSFLPARKEHLIVSIGRFTKGMNTKKQEILIDVFKKLLPHAAGWRLILAGGSRKEDADFVEALKARSQGFPITIVPNCTFSELAGLYSKASIYWHAAGFGENESIHPERVEHFGISTVEAMSAGAVPLVYAAGGQLEIIDDNKDGYLWKTTDVLIEKTMKLMTDVSIYEKMQIEAQRKAKLFSREVFAREVQKLV